MSRNMRYSSIYRFVYQYFAIFYLQIAADSSHVFNPPHFKADHDQLTSHYCLANIDNSMHS